MLHILCVVLLSLVAGQYRAVSYSSSKACAGTPGASFLLDKVRCLPVQCFADASSSDDLKFLQIECISHDWTSFFKTKYANASAPVIIQQLFLDQGCPGEPHQVIARVSGVCHTNTRHTLKNDGSILIETWLPSTSAACPGSPITSAIIPKTQVDGNCQMISKFSVLQTTV